MCRSDRERKDDSVLAVKTSLRKSLFLALAHFLYSLPVSLPPIAPIAPSPLPLSSHLVKMLVPPRCDPSKWSSLLDCAAEELRLAARAVGRVTGAGMIGREEVLDALFRDFCIGK